MNNQVKLTPNELANLTAKAYKYDRLVEELKKYIDNPDNMVEVEDLCVRAGADNQLDEIMDIVGVDGYDELIDKLQKRTLCKPDEERLKATEQVLIDNGIEADEADTVLQAIGYTLLDTELYPGL